MYWATCCAVCVLLISGTVYGKSFLIKGITFKDKTQKVQNLAFDTINRQHNIQGDEISIDRDTVYQSKPKITFRQRARRSNSDHVMQHILDQINKGHMTAESMSHWMGQLQTLYHQGKLDSHDLRDFINDMHQSLAHSPFEGACCPFGK